jgi:predicted metal-dependent hydrolase
MSLLQKGTQLFNNNKYFEAHEIWEEKWKENRDKKLQGLIFIASGYYHYINSNKSGALLFLEKGCNLLQEYNEYKLFLEKIKDNINKIETNQKFEIPKLK